MVRRKSIKSMKKSISFVLICAMMFTNLCVNISVSHATDVGETVSSDTAVVETEVSSTVDTVSEDSTNELVVYGTEKTTLTSETETENGEKNVALRSNNEKVSVSSVTHPGNGTLNRINDGLIGANRFLLLYAKESFDLTNVQVAIDLGNSYDVTKLVIKSRDGVEVYLNSTVLYGSNDPKCLTADWKNAKLDELDKPTVTVPANEEYPIVLDTPKAYRYIVMWNGADPSRNLAIGDLEVYSAKVNDEQNFFTNLNYVSSSNFADTINTGVSNGYIKESLADYNLAYIAPYFSGLIGEIKTGVVKENLITDEASFFKVLKLADFFEALNTDKNIGSDSSDIKEALSISGNLSDIAGLYQADNSVNIATMVKKIEFYDTIGGLLFDSSLTTNEKVILKIQEPNSMFADGIHTLDFKFVSVNADTTETELKSQAFSEFTEDLIEFDYTYLETDTLTDYKVYITASLIGTNATIKKIDAYKHLQPDTAEDYYEALADITTPEALNNAIANCVEYDLINQSDVDELNTITDPDTRVKYLGLAMDAMSLGTFDNVQVALVNEPALFEKCVNITMFLESLSRQSAVDIKADYVECSGFMTGFVTDTFDIDKFASIYRHKEIVDSLRVRTAGASIDVIAQNIRFYDALSQLSGANYETIESILTNYDDRLGFDKATAITDKGYEILDVAKMVDNTIPEAYHTNFLSEIYSIVNSLPKPETDTTTPTLPNYRPSLGGGGGGISISKPKNDENTNNKVEDSTSKEDKTVKEPAIFNDLSGFEWAEDAIINLYSNQIISGKGNGEFAPNDHVKREEMIKMIIVAFDLDTVNETQYEFCDTSSGDWHFSYIQSAYQHGIVNGVDALTFGVGQSISRQDLAVMCFRTMEKKGIALKGISSESQFKDAEALADYAWSAVNILGQNKIFTGFDDGTFRPTETATRAEAAVIINRLLALKGE